MFRLCMLVQLSGKKAEYAANASVLLPIAAELNECEYHEQLGQIKLSDKARLPPSDVQVVTRTELIFLIFTTWKKYSPFLNPNL